MKKLLFIILLVLGTNQSFSQSSPPSLTSATFKKEISRGVVVVEFGAPFAKGFDDWNKLKNCEYYRIDISKYPEYKSKYKLKTLPTIIVFSNGVEEDIFKANIMLEITATPKEIQKAINEAQNNPSNKF